jgi:5-oxoprolinase (ATP-hydrolysing)
LITKGFKDLLKIGNQSRPKIFDLRIEKADVLYEKVLEVPERVTLVGYSSVKSGMNVEIPRNDSSFVKGITGEWVHILQEPDLVYMEQELKKIRSSGITSVAICLMHSFTYSTHEILLEDLCKKLGFTNISVSSKTSPMIKIVSRGTSTSADAYLTPGIRDYMQSFFSGFDAGMLSTINGKGRVKVEFMQSHGGLVYFEKFNGFKAILSGPAGGVVGYATTSYDAQVNKAVIGFDMGGINTS